MKTEPKPLAMAPHIAGDRKADPALAHTTDGMFLVAVIDGFAMVDAQLLRARMRESPNDAIALGGI